MANSNEESKGTFMWCGYEWTSEMEGGRIIHPEYPHYWYSSSDAVIKKLRNGELHFSFRKNPIKIHHWDGKTYNPSIEIGLIRTKQHFDYGTFSIEAIMPKGLNINCAGWLSGNGNWPPEIDVFESWSEDNNYHHAFTNHFPWLCPSWRTTYNVHYRDSKMVHRHLGSKNIMKCDQPLDPTENWIKYECVWMPDKIIFKANGVTIKTVKNKYPKMLTENILNPEKKYLMDYIIDIIIDDPQKIPSRLDTPLKVRNFKYEPFEND